jgi:small subunit ribosomal protein S5
VLTTKIDPDKLSLEERVVRTNKCQKTKKGGRTLSWSALVVVGDGNGHVGAGLGKARAIPDAIRKGVEAAKKNIIYVPIVNHTLPHEIVVKEGAAEVLLKPASDGTGIVAGSSIRVILELAGVRNALAKSLGSSNAINICWATMKALKQMKRPDEVAAMRETSLHTLMPWAAPAEEESAANEEQ